MKRHLMIGVLVASLLCGAAWAEGEEAEEFGGWYAGASAQLVLPQGGARMRRLGGGAARVGCYATDALAFECEAAWLEDRVGLAARALWHLHGWEEFDKLFGYERFDPFVTAGARGWIGRGQVGPSAGVGAVYYLTDEWAIRAEADATLGVDADPAMVYSVSVGVQYSF